MENGNFYEENTVAEKKTLSLTLITKTYLWLFVALLISGITAYLIPVLLIQSGTIEAYLPLIIVSAIVILVCSIVCSIQASKRVDGISPFITLIIYSLSWGVLLSSIAIAYPPLMVLSAFGITSVVFGGFALYGTLTKKSMNGFISFVSGLFIGCLLLFLVNFVIVLVTHEASYYLYMIYEMGFLAIFLIYIIIDANRVIKMQESGETSNSIAAFCALQLYSDFIYILLRVLEILARSNKK